MIRTSGDIIRQSSTLVRLKSSPNDVTASEIRRIFLDYFCKDNKHLHIPSSLVWSVYDPTLAFVNAGMNQFKDVFLGTVTPACSRVANSQKCIRIGGKHNDLSQVGRDGTHHTFFEMLGNWSFGDYFKKEACAFSWDLLTKVYKLPSERLYVTYFKGDESLGLSSDAEVIDIWRDIGVKESHILPFGKKDNFWEMSETGPCGPCTEIHFDHCPGRTDAGSLVNSGRSDLTELWNLVFIQYNRGADNSMTKLENNFVDTGMGFERLVAILQGKISNYDTDLFHPLFEAIKNYTGHTGYTGQYEENSIDCAYRTIADHSRMIAVSLADGIIPNHQHKVRTILRKTINLAEKAFQTNSGLIIELTKHVADSLSDSYPNIGNNLPKIQYLIESEAELFKGMKDKALGQWENLKERFPFIDTEEILESPKLIGGLDFINKHVLKPGKKEITSNEAFVLFQTHGFPHQMMEKLALNCGFAFDVSSYEQYELEMKKTNRTVSHEKSSQISDAALPSEVLFKLKEMNLKPTADHFKYEYEVNDSGKYIFNKQPSTIQAIICGNKVLDKISVEDIQDNEKVALVLDRTQLFSEDVVQESDSGTFLLENKIVFDIHRVVKVKGLAVHFGSFTDFPSDATVTVNNTGVIEINEDKKLKIMRNHTALHLLNAALRNQLLVMTGKISEATAQKLSFTFMVYRDKFDVKDIMTVEEFVGKFIRDGVSVVRKSLDHSKFHELRDVVFMPGEFIIERDIPVIEIDNGLLANGLSREYCTGTHVLNTSEIKDFVITKFAKGSYNLPYIEAVTGEEALRIRKTDSEMKSEWNRLKNEITQCYSFDDLSKEKECFQKLTQFFNKVDNSSIMSHLTKLQLLENITAVKRTLASSRSKFKKRKS